MVACLVSSSEQVSWQYGEYFVRRILRTIYREVFYRSVCRDWKWWWRLSSSIVCIQVSTSRITILAILTTDLPSTFQYFESCSRTSINNFFHLLRLERAPSVGVWRESVSLKDDDIMLSQILLSRRWLFYIDQHYEELEIKPVETR